MTKGNGKPCKKCGTSDWKPDGHCKKCAQIYRQTPGGKAARRREYKKYNSSPLGKASTKKYKQTQRAKDLDNKARRAISRTPQGKARAIATRAKRKVKKTEAGGSFTHREWMRVLDYYNHRCVKCGSSSPLAADHIVSLSNGGTSDISNIQPLCKSCNSSKGTNNTDYRGGNFITRWIQKRLI